EDGIRDFHVTGVQTCALPIFAAISSNRCWTSAGRFAAILELVLRANNTRGNRRHGIKCRRTLTVIYPTPQYARSILRSHDRIPRSEERRVGKEWSAMWSPYH